jgi:hypothetical protein
MRDDHLNYPQVQLSRSQMMGALSITRELAVPQSGTSFQVESGWNREEGHLI